MAQNFKYIKSKYKNVRIIRYSAQNTKYFVSMKGVSEANFKTERECALAVDKLLIRKGKEPVNILKRISK